MSTPTDFSLFSMSAYHLSMMSSLVIYVVHSAIVHAISNAHPALKSLVAT